MRTSTSPLTYLVFIVIALVGGVVISSTDTAAQTDCGWDCSTMSSIFKARADAFRPLMTGKSFGDNRWETSVRFMDSYECVLVAQQLDASGKQWEELSCSFRNTDAAATQHIFEELVREIKRTLPGQVSEAQIETDTKEQLLVKSKSGDQIVNVAHYENEPDYAHLEIFDMPHAADKSLMGKPSDFAGLNVRVISNRTWTPPGHESNGYYIDVAVEEIYFTPTQRFTLECYYTIAEGPGSSCQKLTVGAEVFVWGPRTGLGDYWIDGAIGGKGEQKRFLYKRLSN